MSAGMLPCVTEIIAEDKPRDSVERSSLYAPEQRHYSENNGFRNITGNEPTSGMLLEHRLF